MLLRTHGFIFSPTKMVGSSFDSGFEKYEVADPITSTEPTTRFKASLRLFILEVYSSSSSFGLKTCFLNFLFASASDAGGRTNPHSWCAAVKRWVRCHIWSASLSSPEIDKELPQAQDISIAIMGYSSVLSAENSIFCSPALNSTPRSFRAFATFSLTDCSRDCST